MKKIIVLLITAIFLVGCFTYKTKTKEEKVVLLEEFMITDDLRESDSEIYTLLLKILLQNNPQNLDKEKSDLANGTIVYIDTNSIVLGDETYLALDEYKTYDDNMVGKVDYINKKFSSIHEEIISDFIERNRSKITLTPLFDLLDFVMNSHLIQSEMESSGSTSYWDSVYSLFPDTAGVVSFSAIGYNSDETEAFVDVQFMSGSSSGNISYLYLQKKKDGAWEVVDSLIHRHY